MDPVDQVSYVAGLIRSKATLGITHVCKDNVFHPNRKVYSNPIFSVIRHAQRLRVPLFVTEKKKKHVDFRHVRVERLGGAEYQWSYVVEEDSPVEWRRQRRWWVGDRVLVEATEKGDGSPQEDEAA